MTQQGLTSKEAIERLKCMRLFMQINDKDSTSKFLDEDYVANDMAIKALERNIAKKPIGIAMEKTELLKVGKCPNCGAIIGEYALWCDDCGQRLDWSES